MRKLVFKPGVQVDWSQTDGELAKKWGVCRQTVMHIRVRMGQRARRRGRPNKPKIVEPTPFQPVGTENDGQPSQTQESATPEQSQQIENKEQTKEQNG